MMLIYRFGKAALLVVSIALVCISGRAEKRIDSVKTERLIIHASELGVGKFHRQDNKVHNYGADNAWTPYVLGDKTPSEATPVFQKNPDGSVTIFFSNLDELMGAVARVAKEEGRLVSVLNVHGHGIPGGMWYPKDAQTQASQECQGWRATAESTDEVNYSRYYSPVQKYQMMLIRELSQNASMSTSFECVTDLADWRALAEIHTDFTQALAPDLQVHFLSCVVGLGNSGDNFAKGIAQILISGPKGRVSASVNYGLSDWSMSAGLGFWDFQTDEQLNKDNDAYPINKRDADMAQLGSVRIAVGSRANVQTGIVDNLKFMGLGFDPTLPIFRASQLSAESDLLFQHDSVSIPDQITLPGTSFSIKARR